MKHHNYKKEWLILLLAVAFSILSLGLDCLFADINWFGRSGSVIVLLAAFVEFRVSFHVYDDIQRAQYQNTIISTPIPIKAKPTKERNKISIASHTLLILGTLVWGYGDLLWPKT